MLQELGYTVLEAADGEDAVRVFQENKDRVQLILCDLIMPKKSGRETLEEIKKIKPAIKAIFMSGYTADVIEQKDLMDEGKNFLSKPASMVDLAGKIRAVLES